MDNYYWADDIVNTGLAITVYDETQCWLYTDDTVSIDTDRITLSELHPNSTDLDRFCTKRDDGEIYDYEGLPQQLRFRYG